MKRNCILCLALCACGLSGTTWAGPCYDVEVLLGSPCPIFGTADVWPEDIASDGTVIGTVGLCDDGAKGFVWPMVDEPYLIVPPPGATSVSALCVNDTGQVGVFMGGTGLGGGHVYDLATGSFTPIGVPPGGNFIKPHGINNLAHACGEWGNDLTGEPALHAFVATERGPFDLGSLLTGPNSIAHDINDLGSVVGEMGNFAVIPLLLRGFLYRDGKATDLLAPGCYSSIARGVNARDEVACTGAQSVPGGVIGHAFVWREGTWTQLDHLPGYQNMSGVDINDSGIVIGNLTNPGNSAYVSIDGVTYDLKLRIPADSNVEIKFAKAINNAGQIACEATMPLIPFGMAQVGVRLTPRPPQPADFTGDCTVDGEDLMILLQSWGPVLPSPSPGSGRGAGGEGRRRTNPAADLDGNGIVNGFDLAILLGAWG